MGVGLLEPPPLLSQNPDFSFEFMVGFIVKFGGGPGLLGTRFGGSITSACLFKDWRLGARCLRWAVTLLDVSAWDGKISLWTVKTGFEEIVRSTMSSLSISGGGSYSVSVFFLFFRRFLF